VDLDDEGGRFEARHAIAAVLAPWFARHGLAEIGRLFEGSGILWGPYQDFGQLVREDPRCSPANPVFSEVDQPGVGRVLAPGVPLAFSGAPRPDPRAAPRLGEHSDAVLAEVLGLSAAAIGALHDSGVVAGPDRR
jgi:2-methylfumaryl-CoA isomerase